MNSINFFGPINHTGYGVHSTNLGLALCRINSEVNLNWFPIGDIQYNGSHKDLIETSVKRARAEFDASAPSINLWHAHDMSRFHGSPRIGYPVFELDRLSKIETTQLLSCDEIWVTSEWAKSVVLGNSKLSNKKVSVIPEGVDPSLFRYSDTQRQLKDRLTLLNIGKFEVRKGHLHLLELLKTSRHNIDLIAHWNNFFVSRDEIIRTISDMGFNHIGKNYLDGEALAPKIMCDIFSSENGNRLFFPTAFLPGENPTIELINRADLGIFPYSSEGWNLPLIECMATGLPCIATLYSGPTEYLTEDNSFNIVHDGLIPARDGRWFHGNGKWASIRQSNLQSLLDNIISDGHKGLSRVRNALNGFGEKWAWSNTANKVVQTLSC